MGLRVHLAASSRLTAAVGGAVELHLFRGGYAGLAVQEDGRGNLCLAVKRSVMMDAGGPAAFLRTIDRVAPSLAGRVDAMDARFDAVANIPYGWRAKCTVPGVFRLGDQAGVIPSLAGEGMGIAIASGVAAANAHAAGGMAAAEDWQRDFARRLRRPIAVAGLVRDAAATPLLGLAHIPGLMQIIAIATRADHDAP
jgi:flavin-dependent dehydrogenase